MGLLPVSTAAAYSKTEPTTPMIVPNKPVLRISGVMLARNRPVSTGARRLASARTHKVEVRIASETHRRVNRGRPAQLTLLLDLTTNLNLRPSLGI